MSYSLYTKILITCISMFLVPIFALSIYMEPESNELTRMGGYLENDFGWNMPQEHFVKPLFNMAESIEDYQHYYDVVVIGDSFSEDESHGWQNYFANLSGLSIITFSFLSVKPDDLINSQIYRQKPPKLFIYQIVERNIIGRHNYCDAGAQAAKKIMEARPIQTREMKVEVDKKHRNKRWYSLTGLDISAALNYLKKSVTRNLLGLNLTEVQEFKLSRDDLFSSNTSDTLLILTRDFNLKGTTSKQIETAKCSLLSLQADIKGSANTEFITIVFPNKSTAYSDYVLDKTLSDMSIAAEIENTEGLNITSLVHDYKRAVSSGVVDLYLPNDTHTGFYAYQMAARSTLRLLSDLQKTR